MRVAVIGNVTEGDIDIARYLPENTGSILYLRGHHTGECANRYADAHALAKLGYPARWTFPSTTHDAEHYAALVDDAEYVLLLYSRPCPVLSAVRKYAIKKNKLVGIHFIKPADLPEAE